MPVMDFTPSFIFGAGLGVALGLIVVWFAVLFRIRERGRLAVSDLAERLNRSETMSGELRRQLEEEQRLVLDLRRKLADAQTACAVAETKRGEAEESDA